MRRTLFIFGLLTMAAASNASFTLATFGDPSNGGNNPLFDWDTVNNTLSGSWTASGLLLQTPGFNGGGSVADAHFVMNAVTLTPVINGVLYTMGPGTIDFYTNNINNPFFTIGFNGGSFLNPLNASASAQSGNTVNFTGPNVPGNLTNQSFAFSLANPTQVGSHWTYTSSFTSSADVVPEPATMLILGSGLAAFAARRRKS